MAFFSDRIMQRAERHALRFAKRFTRNEDGATAIEFAIVALPFFALLFGILELAVVFFINSALVQATAEAGRVLRVDDPLAERDPRGLVQHRDSSRRGFSEDFTHANPQAGRKPRPGTERDRVAAGGEPGGTKQPSDELTRLRCFLR